MRALLDTSAFLWFIGGSDKLSVHAQNVIMDLDNRIVLIMVSLWEIAIKVSLGKLALVKPYEQIIPQQIEENDIELLPIAHNHLTKIIDLPFHHRDPFDRLIIAQAMTEGIPIISPDAVFSQYPIKLIW
jgi:PIN domain nuclease of toxin-antitoxin system